MIKYQKILLTFIFLYLISGCQTNTSSIINNIIEDELKIPVRSGGVSLHLITTGYCSCEKCTGWRRNWKRQPVFKKGKNKGKLKKVGITADGTKAKKGIIAADITAYPFGTEIFIPGYGMGEVHDVGTAIDSKFHIDLFFPSHREALEWGRQILTIKVWKKEAVSAAEKE